MSDRQQQNSKSPGVAVRTLRPKRSNSWSRRVFLLAGVSALLAAGCGKTEAGNQGAAGAAQAMPVQVTVAKLQKIPDTTEYLSVLKSRHSATINPQVEGQITKIFAKSGDRVTAGTPLLQIDPLKQQATVSSQQAAVAA